MGMLEDRAEGLTPEQIEKGRAYYMHSIDPENNPDPDAPEPIPVWGPEGPPVQDSEAYTNNVRDEKVDEDNPFADAELSDEVATEAGDSTLPDDPFADAAVTDTLPEQEDDPDNPFDDAELEEIPEPPMPEPEPKKKEGSALDAAVGGWKKMANAVATEVASLFGEIEEVEALAAEAAGIREGDTEATKRFQETLAKKTKEGDNTIWDGLTNVLETAWEEKQGFGHMAAEQAANSLPTLAGGWAGMQIGATVGSVVPGLGTAIGGLVGGIAGMFAGNMAIEGGYAVQEEAAKPGMVTQEEMSAANIGASKKAAVITGIDMITMGASRLIAGGPGRAARKAVEDTLVKNGVDIADKAAVEAALGTEKIMREAADAATKAMADATGTVLGKTGRVAGEMGLEMAGEGTGEYLGTLASGKEASFTEAALEAFMSGPTSATEVLFVNTYKTAKNKIQKQLGPTKDAAAALERDIEQSGGPQEPPKTGPADRVEQAAEQIKQDREGAARRQEIENAQDSARERVLANGGDMLDAELEAAKVGADMGLEDAEIQRFTNMVNRQTEGELTRREGAATAPVEDVTQTVKEKKKAAEEDKAYADRDKVTGIGQTGVDGHIPSGPGATTDETVAGETRQEPVRGNQMAEAFARAANEAATSPTNDLATPTQGQKEAGNYKKGHQRLHGLDITIENPAGSTREAADGSWKQSMKDHYGYIKGTESAEGKTEQLDVFVGENLESKQVFVVDQINKEGAFDEHKVMMGYGNAVEARRAYARNYPQGFRVGKITPMSVPQFKEWLKNGDQTQPVQPLGKAGGPLAASAGQQKEVIRPTSLDGERTTRTLTAGEQAEQRLEQMPGRKVRYRMGHDKDGTLYHATPENFEQFRNMGENIGIHMGTKQAANDIVTSFTDEGVPIDGWNIRQVLAAIKNPFRAKDTGFYQSKPFLDWLEPDMKALADKRWPGWETKGFDTGIPMSEIREWLQELGYDGIVYENESEDKGSDSYIAFSPDQIRNAIGNREKTVNGKKIRYRLGDQVDAKELLSRLNNDNDGFTVDNATGKDKKSGFAVGIGKEKVFDKKPTKKQVDAYRKQHAVALQEDGNYLGAWVYEGKFFMDVSKVYPDTEMGRKRAYADAKSRGEYGIQDLSKPPAEGYIGIEYKPGEQEAARKKNGIKYRREEADGDKYFDDRAWSDAEAESRGNSRTTIIHITPDQFLRMAETLRRPDEQKAREVQMLVDEGVAFNSMPVLIFQNQGTVAKTTGHEGRHRALALKAKGVTSMPVRLVSGEGGPVGAIRFNYHDGPVPTTMEGQSGGTMKFPWSPAQEEEVTEAPHEGRAFKNFFSAVTAGLTGKSSTGATYTPVVSAVAASMAQQGSPVNTFTTEYIKHRGNFDDHIAFSIPGYKEVQQAVGAALTQNYGAGQELLDIGASEGSFAKAVTAISGMKSTSLDPNPQMAATFDKVSQVPGAEYSMTALGAADQEGEAAWVEDDGTEIEYFDPMGKKYDVVHEAMVFQFVSNERAEQFKRVAELVADNGLFITEEKVFTKNQAANEAKKNAEHKAKYFEKKDLDAKSAEVLEGMHKNMVQDFVLEQELARNFTYVAQFWDSGNFKGYMASNSRTTLDNVLKSMPSLQSDFATSSTPRMVSTGNTRKRIGGNEKVNVPMSSAKAKDVLGPIIEKMPLLAPEILSNPSEAPADLYAQMQKDGALKAKGVFDPETGKLYIFSENHDSNADVIRTLLHEGVAHKGLRYLLGDNFEATMQDVFKNGDTDAMNRIARRYGLDPSNAEDIVEIAEEYIAYLAEHDVKSTVLQRVVAAVRQMFRSIGVVKAWTDADLHALLARSGRRLKGKPMRKAMITKSFIIEETGEQIDVEVSADVELRNIQKRKEACEAVRKCAR